MTNQASVEVLEERLKAAEKVADDIQARVIGHPGATGLEDKVIDILSRISSLEFWRNMWIPRLEGNGKKPLMQRVDELETWQNNRDKEVQEKRSDQRSIKLAIILMIVSSLWGIIKDFILPINTP